MRIRSASRPLFVAALFVIVTSSLAEGVGRYFPVWQKQRPNITDLALIYQGGEQRPQWTLERYAPYVSCRDPQSGKEQWLFDGFLFIEFADGQRCAFQPWPGVSPAQKSDWFTLLEKNFAADDGIPNLERICRDTAARIGRPSRPRQVLITVPEPILGQTNWGELDSRALDFRKTPDRLAALGWYMDAALQKWQALAPQQLELAGFYWGCEGSRRTNEFLPGVARLVHARNKQFFWIPYWDASGAQCNWRSFGFDAAWQQPNHFFHPEIADTRLNEACAFAKQHGMGLEMEFDGRMLDNPPDFERRFEVYLDAFTRLGVKDSASIAYYEGGGALVRLANSREPKMRAQYDRIARFILYRQTLADEQCHRPVNQPIRD